MAIHLFTETLVFEIGTSDFFMSFFDTIDFHLTKGILARKYPIVLGEFQQGKLKYENLDKGERELKLIQNKLSKFKPSEMIWDKHDLNKKPPWGNNISSEITNLSNYFVTSDGKNLFDVIYRAINQAKSEKCDLTIK